MKKFFFIFLIINFNNFVSASTKQDIVNNLIGIKNFGLILVNNFQWMAFKNLKKTLIIAEAGNNHEGKIENAKN